MIEGFRIERLLDRAHAEGIGLRQLRVESELAVFCLVTAEDLKRLRRLAGPLYRITVIREKGFGFAAGKFFASPVTVIGVLLAAALVISQSFFVKTIEVDGYRRIPETLLRECLAESGVREGAYRPSIDWREAERRLYDAFPQITWLKLAYDGRRVFLTVAETEDENYEPAAREKIYSNLVAAEAGYVETASARRGLLLVEEGDFVQKGQVLVSGYVPLSPTYYDEDPPEGYFVRAEGEIWARTPVRLTFNQERFVKSPAAEGGEVVSAREKTRAEAEREANRQLRRWQRENLPENAEILNKSLNFSYKENIIEISMTIEVRRQIAKEQEILIGQEGTDTSGD